MNIQDAFNEYIEARKYRLSLNLGDCTLDEKPFENNPGEVVYKAILHGKEVALKFILIENKLSLSEIRKKYIIAATMEPSHYQPQYIDYDELQVQEAIIPVLVMKLSLYLSEEQKGYHPDELLKEFNLVCRKNFPKELPEFVHCTEQKRILKLMNDFVARKDYFGNSLIYFTDVEKKVFSPQISKEGFIKFDNSTELKILDIWVHSDNDMKNDYILVHHANTQPTKVNGKDTHKWAVYDNKTLITWAEAMNGFAEFEGDIIPLDPAKLEFFDRIPLEGYLFIALNRHHNMALPMNANTLKDYFFRFSFSYVNRYILEDMNNTMRLHLKHQLSNKKRLL